jgi:hypothetical protein
MRLLVYLAAAAAAVLLSLPAQAAHHRHSSYSVLSGSQRGKLPSSYGYYNGPVFDGYGRTVGTYRGPILGYAGTSCEILTPSGYRDTCAYDQEKD